MGNSLTNLYVKFRLFYPVFIGSILAIALITFILVSKARDEVLRQAEANMQLEVSTIKSMFDRERELKLARVMENLKVAHRLFYEQPLAFDKKTITIAARDQHSGMTDTTALRVMMRNGQPIYSHTDFPDELNALVGGTATIFQKMGKGYVRISTNVPDDEGMPAIGTYIPNDSPVVDQIEKGLPYVGRAFVVNDWYITAYEPLYFADTLAGMLYVGDQEKDLDKLRHVLQHLYPGSSGFILVTNNEGTVVIGPADTTLRQVAGQALNSIKTSTNKQSNLKWITINGEDYLIANTDYPPFDFTIRAVVPLKELTHGAIESIILTAILTALLISVVFILMVLFTTTRRVHRLLNAIRLSNIKLRSTKDALRQSEYNFRTLFNNSSDEMLVSDMQGNILEMNEMACKTLEYTREELLAMNIMDLKPDRNARSFMHNRGQLQRTGSLIYDSEYITKSGQLIPVEINSRLLDFNQKEAILSISRNLKTRNELERKVLSAVIQTEERERERFSKDMHDGLGPLLSTVKLYVGELIEDGISREEKKEYSIQVNNIIDEAVSSIREISNNLMPRVIHEYGVVRALQAFCDKINKTNRLHISFTADGVDQQMNKNTQLILFRVISELTTNTLKHARATEVTIDIKAEGEHIRVEFKDNGIGFNTEKIMSDHRVGIGLKSIISRIRSINGHCHFHSEEGKGFRIIIEI